jgi:putative tryptophan/tyrosine transport system substrate-binding protein
VPVVGFLDAISPGAHSTFLAAFRRGLNETGYIEGQNVAVEYRWAEGKFDRLPALAIDLASRRVAAIFAGSNAAAQVAKPASPNIPLVFAIGGDPVQLGLVASMNRPGGNITGVSFFSTVIVAKLLELLHATVPGAHIVAALVNPANPNAASDTREAQEAARTLGLQVDVLNASTESEIDAAFATLMERRVGALLIAGDPFFLSRLDQITALLTRHAMPAIFNNPDFAHAGGLMSYATSIPDAYRIAGTYVGRILKGEKPADLPVQQPTKFELVINLVTAKTLGLTVPETLLATADEVIE